jgi:hypothetical protein
MQHLNNLTNWIIANPGTTLTIFGVVANVANGLLKMAGPNVAAVARFLRTLLDLVSVTTNKDATGTLKMPFKRSTYLNGVKKKGKNMNKLMLVPILIGSMLMSGCACWGADAQKKSCVVARQIVDCSKSTGVDLALHVAPALIALISSGAMDLPGLLSALTAEGFTEVDCIVQALRNDFASQPNLSPGAKKFVQDATRHLAQRRSSCR